MAASVIMPALEMAQDTGKIVSWLKQEGDAVTKGEPILEVETDKAVVEIEATADGLLAGIKSREGEVVPVGVTIAWIVAPGEEPPAETPTAAPSARPITEQARPGTATATPVPAQSASTADAAIKISPKARRMAKELGVNISRIRGTGPEGSITGDDVLAASQAPAAVAVEDSNAPESPPALATISRLMAERTTQSWTQVPHFYLVRDIDAGALVQAREQMAPAVERDCGVKITHTDLLVALTARVLQKHPKLNATWTGDAVRTNPHVNISLAVAVPDGVVGAVIPNAETASVAEIALLRRELTDRARSGRLRPSDLSAGTFTISNLGMYDIDAFSAIIAAPQAGSLAVGRIAERVVAVDGQPAVRAMMTVTLSGDHRVIDGAQGALFLRDLAAALQAPDAALQPY